MISNPVVVKNGGTAEKFVGFKRVEMDEISEPEELLVILKSESGDNLDGFLGSLHFNSSNGTVNEQFYISGINDGAPGDPQGGLAELLWSECEVAFEMRIYSELDGSGGIAEINVDAHPIDSSKDVISLFHYIGGSWESAEGITAEVYVGVTK